MVSAIEMNNPLRDSFQRDNFSYFFFPQWYLELLRFIAHLVALFGDATSLFSSSNDILSNGLARWWFELSVMAPAIETNNQVHHQRGNLTCFYILQSIFRGIEINKPLSWEILCFLDDILSEEFARCWIELSVMESSGEVEKPLSLSSFVTFTAVEMGWIPRQGWNTGERKGWNALKQPLHESLGVGVVLEVEKCQKPQKK